jgi:uncharacterized alpha-E superfamily protein
LSEALEQLDRVVLALAAFGGLANDSVTRGDGWRFLDLGRKLERALETVSLLRNTLVFPASPEAPLLEALLEIADSSMTYRRRYQGSVQPAAVLDLLLADEGNPRSLAFQLAVVTEHVERLPREIDNSPGSPEQSLLKSTLETVRATGADRLAASDDGIRRTALEMLLVEVGRVLRAASDAVTHAYLSHLETSRHLGLL